MNKYISMLNPYSFYYLWKCEEGKKYIQDLINSLLGKNQEYELLNFFNSTLNNVRSYLIFESNDSIILLDFNINGRYVDDDLGIINFLEASISKKIYLIMFNNFKGKNSFSNNIYYYFKDKSFLFANSYSKQLEKNKVLTNYLYTMNEDIFKLYNHELELLFRL